MRMRGVRGPQTLGHLPLLAQGDRDGLLAVRHDLALRRSTVERAVFEFVQDAADRLGHQNPAHAKMSTSLAAHAAAAVTVTVVVEFAVSRVTVLFVVSVT